MQSDLHGASFRLEDDPEATFESFCICLECGQSHVLSPLELGKIGLGHSDSNRDLRLREVQLLAECRELYRRPLIHTPFGASPTSADPCSPKRRRTVHRVGVHQSQHTLGELAAGIPGDCHSDGLPFVEIATFENVDNGSEWQLIDRRTSVDMQVAMNHEVSPTT